MLVKLITEWRHGLLRYRSTMDQVNIFDNLFKYRFYASRSQKRKETVKLSVFFSLLGSAHTKAAHKMLVKLTPG